MDIYYLAKRYKFQFFPHLEKVYFSRYKFIIYVPLILFH